MSDLYECKRLMKLLTRLGITVGPIGEATVHIQGTYDPANDSAILALYGVDDSALVPLLATWVAP